MADHDKHGEARFGVNMAWTTGGRAASESLRVVGHLVLTRLLPPEAFGLFLLLNTFVQGLAMFSDFGANASIIQNRRGDEQSFLDTAWTLQVARGFLLWVICVAAAPFISDFYSQPDLNILIPVGAASLIFAGFTSPALPLLQRRLQLRRWVTIDLVAQVTAVSTMLILAWWTRSVWALIAGTLITSLTLLVISHGMKSAYRPKFGWHADAARAIFGFGIWILLNTPLGWLADNADRLALGRLVPIDVLGVFYIAAMVGGLPFRLLVAVGGNAVFPTFSKSVHTKAHLPSVYAQVEYAVLTMGALAVSGLVAFGPHAIDLLLDPRWHEAAAMLVPIAASQWFRIAAIPPANALFALGYPQYLVLVNLAKVSGYIVFVPSAILLMSSDGNVVIPALWGFAAGEAIAPVLYRILLVKHIPAIGWTEYRTAFLLAISCTLIVLGYAWMEAESIGMLFQLGFGVVVVATFWGLPALRGATSVVKLVLESRRRRDSE